MTNNKDICRKKCISISETLDLPPFQLLWNPNKQRLTVVHSTAGNRREKVWKRRWEKDVIGWWLCRMEIKPPPCSNLLLSQAGLTPRKKERDPTWSLVEERVKEVGPGATPPPDSRLFCPKEPRQESHASNFDIKILVTLRGFFLFLCFLKLYENPFHLQ